MTLDPISRKSLAAMIEHTFLNAFGGPESIENLCSEARSHEFGAVIVNPAEIDRCRVLLEGSSIRIGTVIGFPLGQNASVVKAFETQDALARGAMDIDLVINVRALQAGENNVVRREMASLGESCREHGALSKVIVECCYLDQAQKRTACELALAAGVDFVKTSTGFGSGGATVADVKLMRSVVGQNLGVKAAGGIRDLATAQAMIDAGANRLGTSSGIAILEELGR